MELEILKRIEELEKRAATLEGQVQEQQSTKNCEHLVFYYLNMAQYLINKALPLVMSFDELFANEPTHECVSNGNSNIRMFSE